METGGDVTGGSDDASGDPDASEEKNKSDASNGNAKSDPDASSDSTAGDQDATTGSTTIDADLPAGAVRINEENFPDSAFREEIGKSTYDQNGDGVLSKDELEAVTLIKLQYSDATSLAGVEYFTNLETLICEFGKLSDLLMLKRPCSQGIL